MMLEGSFEYKGNKVKYFSNSKTQPHQKQILLLHGFSFNSKVWEEIGLIDLLEQLGYNIYALDIPGFPKSSNRFNLSEEEQVELLSQLLSKVIKKKVVILGASAGAYLSLKLAEHSSNKIEALIAVGPAQLDRINWKEISTKLFGIWGSNDTISDPREGTKIFESHKAKTAIINNARHACYLDKPDEFKKVVKEFLESVK